MQPGLINLKMTNKKRRSIYVEPDVSHGNLLSKIIDAKGSRVKITPELFVLERLASPWPIRCILLSPDPADDQLAHVLPLEVAGGVVHHRDPDPPLKSVVQVVLAPASHLVAVVNQHRNVFTARGWKREQLRH